MVLGKDLKHACKCMHAYIHTCIYMHAYLHACLPTYCSGYCSGHCWSPNVVLAHSGRYVCVVEYKLCVGACGVWYVLNWTIRLLFFRGQISAHASGYAVEPSLPLPWTIVFVDDWKALMLQPRYTHTLAHVHARAHTCTCACTHAHARTRTQACTHTPCGRVPCR